MHWQKSSTPEQPPPLRPYQGVRVKEPVKELLKRKRGSLQNANVAAAAAATTVFFPHQTLPSYSPAGPVCGDPDFLAPSLPVTDEGSLYSGWLAQPSPASLQPLAQWAAYPDYVSHEAVSCPYTADMYVQPVCPSYALVGSSSVLTYTSQPLLTNFAARPATSLDVMDQQGPVGYFPWTQSISTLPAPSLQYPPAPAALPAPQFVPLPVSLPEPGPQELEEARKELGPNLSIEKLLLQGESSGTFDLSHSLPVEGL